MRTTPIMFALAALMLDCATLTPISEGTCGNGVIDANEDCDSFPATCGHAGEGVRACRLTCDRKQANSCPVGWGCSVDGVCRQATGTFDAASAPSSAGVVTLLAGDFDGDGRTDLFGGGPQGGVSKPRIHFFDSNATPAAPVSIQFPMSAPVVRDFDGDGRDDLAYAFNANEFGGIGLLAGTTDRAFTPVLFPTITKPATEVRMVTLPYDPSTGSYLPSGASAAITVERTASGTFFRSVSGATLVSLDELEQPAPFGPEQVVGSPERGSIFAPLSLTPPSACGEVVFAYNAGNVGHIAILSPCAAVGSGSAVQVVWAKRPLKDVTLPAKVSGKTLVVDIDGDGYAEIFVTTDSGTYVAASDGTTLSAFQPFREGSGSPLPTPLAVGDLDGDGTLDVALPTGFYTSGKAGAPTPDADAGGGDIGGTNAARPTTGRWADARIGDFNGDALPDLIALSPEALEIEFFANAGNSRLTRFSVASDQPIRAITTGDFDGDRIQDIAFLASTRELGDPEVVGETELQIAYGKASGGPEAARVVGRFKEARSLATMRRVDKSVDTIVVAEATPVKGQLATTSLTYMVSSGDRQVNAPLIFGDALATVKAADNQIRLWLPAALVAAPLVTPGSVDMMSIACGITLKIGARQDESPYVRPFPTGTWLAKSSKTAVGGLEPLKEVYRFDPKMVRALDDARFDAEGVLETLLVSTAGDIDSPPDGISEIVSLARGQKPGTTDLMIVRQADLGAARPPTVISLADFAVTGADDALALFDLDADDLPDAVVITRGKNRDKLRVYLNDGHGGFLATPLVLDMPRAANPDAVPDPPVSFSRVVTGVSENGKPRTELAVVSKSQLLLARVNANKTAFDVNDLTKLLGLPLSDRITAVAGGDFDGDGVQDLAIADSGSIRLLRQQPRLR